MLKISSREFFTYLLFILIFLAFSSCSPGKPNLTPVPSPVSMIEDNQELEIRATPTVTIESPYETDHHLATASSGNTPIAEIEIQSYPLGEYLVYFDWTSESLYLFDGNENEPDLRVANHWGVFSPDAMHFAFIKENTILTLIDLEGDSVTQFPLGMSCYSDPSWSKEGYSLAIGCEDNIYVYSLKDNSIIRLTSWGQSFVDSFLSPLWSPDGSKIAYLYRNLTSLSSTPENGIYVTDVKCLSNPDTCLEYSDGPFFPYALGGPFAWSPDSQRLVFSEDLHSIRLVDLSTKKDSLVLDNLDSIDGLVWSPDSELVAYSIEGKLYTIPVTGGEPDLIAKDKGYLIAWVKKSAE